jgi:hypothetical protein
VYAPNAEDSQHAQAAYAAPAPAASPPGAFAVAVAAANLVGVTSSLLSGISIPLTSAAARMLRDLGFWTSSSGSSGSGSSGIGEAFSPSLLSDYRRAFESGIDCQSGSGSDFGSVGVRGSGGFDGPGGSDSQGDCEGSPVSETASDGGSDAGQFAEEHVPPQMPTVEPSSGAGARRDSDTDVPLNRELAY